MDRNKVTEIKTLNKTRFLSFYEAKYENKKGNNGTWMIASRKGEEDLKEKFFNGKKDKDDAVVIAALHKPSNKLVLIKQFRIPVNDYVYEVPAGLVDEGEEAKSSVIRELKEETGLTVTKIIEKGKGKLYLSPGMTDESVSLVYCICEGCISTESLEDDECIEPMLISKEEAKEIMYSDNNIDAKCFILLQSFSILGEKLFED